METIKNFFVGIMVILKIFAVGVAGIATGYYLFLFLGKAVSLMFKDSQNPHISTSVNRCLNASLLQLNSACLEGAVISISIIVLSVSLLFLVFAFVAEVGKSSRNKLGKNSK